MAAEKVAAMTTGYQPQTLDPAAPPPSTTAIAYFLRVSADDLTEALNELIRDVNFLIASIQVGQYSPFVGEYAVANLPTPSGFSFGYATNGLKVGETTGNGTGVPVYYSDGAWRVMSTDAPVQA